MDNLSCEPWARVRLAIDSATQAILLTADIDAMKVEDHHYKTWEMCSKHAWQGIVISVTLTCRGGRNKT